MLLLKIIFALILVHALVCVCIGKEFPDMRQNERIEFIRVGYAVRTADQPKGEPKLVTNFYSLKTERIPAGRVALGGW